MDTIFKDLILSGEVVIYMDDILIATPDNLTHHWQLVHRVLDWLEEHDLSLKPKKCIFEVREVEFLGIIIGHGQVHMDPVKVQGILDWPIPQNLRDVHSFLGLYSFYWRFIKGFATLAWQLNNLLKKEVPWEWTPARQHTFEILKGRITQAPVLAMPDYEKPFELEVDASNYALGAVLNQWDSNNQIHPVAFYSATLSAAKWNFDIYDKELLAIHRPLKHWQHYLVGSPHKIIIHTNHSNLQYWKEARKISRRIACEFLDLSEYNFVIKHVPGTSNVWADALSQRADYTEKKEGNNDIVVLPQEVFISQTTTSPHNIHKHCQKAQKDNTTLLQALIDPHSLKLHDHLWYKSNALVVVGNNSLKRGVIRLFHDLPSTGHPGIANTWTLISRDYWWPNMPQDVEEYVKGCTTCQANKVNKIYINKNHGYSPSLQTQKRNHSK